MTPLTLTTSLHRLIPEWSHLNRHRMVIPGDLPPLLHRNLLQLADFLRAHLPLEIHQPGPRLGHLPPNSAIWVRDYHPLPAVEHRSQQVTHIAFDYEPAYAPRLSKDLVRQAQRHLAPQVMRATLILDGGNLIHNGQGDLVMTSRVLKDNQATEAELLLNLRQYLEVRHLIIVPEEPGDVTGHIDGFARFLSEDTIALNHYAGMPRAWNRWYLAVKEQLEQFFHILTIESEPPLPITGEGLPSAYGNRLNWIRHEDLIIFPAYGMQYDRHLAELLVAFGLEAIPAPEELFALPSHFGGSLHCLTAEFVV
jgi:agmatine/peptidylarginine deiminase